MGRDIFQELEREEKLTFEVIPAIDIRGGFCVRLLHGDYDHETRYDSNPVAVAKQWEKEGASLLHVVDLDGAKDGYPVNSELIAEICLAVDIPVEVSGGIRTRTAIEDAFTLGASRVQLGSVAVQDIDLVRRAVEDHPTSLTVALDIRNGQVYVDGLRSKASGAVHIDPFDFAIQLASIGVPRLMVTDISRDGALKGANTELMSSFVEKMSIPVVASGGVASIADILLLSDIGCEGVVVGKALYEKVFSISEVKAVLKNAN